LKLIFWLLIGYIFFRIIRGYLMERQVDNVHGTAGGATGGKAGTGADDEAFRDPVCGVYVTEDDAVIGRLDGKRIHFCSLECLDKYREQITHK
jgi:YHS domain-containing protein